jgi:serine/threonine protein kinase
MKAMTADDPLIIGEFRGRVPLGRGGMGQVYLGLSPPRPAVAVKVLHPELARDDDFLRRFEREIAAARSLHGPGRGGRPG